MLACHGIPSARYSLLAEAGLCLEPPNCSKEHLGTEARVSPLPTVQHLLYQGPTKEVAWEPTS